MSFEPNLTVSVLFALAPRSTKDRFQMIWVSSSCKCAFLALRFARPSLCAQVCLSERRRR